MLLPLLWSVFTAQIKVHFAQIILLVQAPPPLNRGAGGFSRGYEKVEGDLKQEIS